MACKRWDMDFNLHFEGSISSVQCVINSAASFMSKTKNIATIYYLSPPNSRHVLIICSFGCLGNERPPWKIPLLCFSFLFLFFLFGTMENPTLVKIILCMLWTLNLPYNIICIELLSPFDQNHQISTIV